MSGTNNRLAAALAAPTLGERVERELWERGGRQLYKTRPAPLSAREVKDLVVDSAVSAAEQFTDADKLAELWRIDKRVAVRDAISRNPNLDRATALAAIERREQREEKVTFQLAELAGIDETLELLDRVVSYRAFHSSLLCDGESVRFVDLPTWVQHLTFSQVLGLASKGWAAEIVVWRMLKGVSAGHVNDDDVDQLWARTGDDTKLLALECLMNSNAGLSRRWLQRLSGHGDLCAHAAYSHGYDSFPIEAPELLVELCSGLPAEIDQIRRMVAFFERLERRIRLALNDSGADGPAIPPEVANKLIVMLDTAGAHIDQCRYEYTWLVSRASADAAPDVAKLLEQFHSGWYRGTRAAHVVHSYVRDCALGDDIADVLRATGAPELVERWLAGEFPANQPTARTVASLISHDPPEELCSIVAARPDMWAVDVEHATAVLRYSSARAALVASEQCPTEAADALFAWVENREVQLTGTGWVRNVVAALSECRKTEPTAVVGDGAAALLKHFEAPEHLRATLARQGAVTMEWCAGHFELNPVTEEALASDPIWAPARSDENVTEDELLAIASNENVDVELRARAALRTDHTSDAPIESIVSAGTLSLELLCALTYRDMCVLAKWVAGVYVENPAPPSDVALHMLEGTAGLPGAASEAAALVYAEHCGDDPDPVILEWIASQPRVLTHVTDVSLMKLARRIVADRLGDDVVSWLLFAELGEGSEMSVNDVLDLVAASRDLY